MNFYDLLIIIIIVKPDLSSDYNCTIKIFNNCTLNMDCRVVRETASSV